MTIKEKMEIVYELFTLHIQDSCTNKIDYLEDEADGINEGCSFGWSIASYYLSNSIKVTKYDLKYINEIIKNLIKILSLDIDKITPEYIQSKINYDKRPFKPDADWINAYKKLITYINSQ